MHALLGMKCIFLVTVIYTLAKGHACEILGRTMKYIVERVKLNCNNIIQRQHIHRVSAPEVGKFKYLSERACRILQVLPPQYILYEPPIQLTHSKSAKALMNVNTLGLIAYVFFLPLATLVPRLGFMPTKHLWMNSRVAAASVGYCRFMQ